MDQFSAPRLLLTALALATPALGGCAAKATADTPAARAPVAIAIARAQPAPDLSLFTGSGTVVAAHTYRLAFEIAGRVSAVNVDVGDRVAPGQILATLDDAAYREQADSAGARMQEADAQAERARNGARPQERSAALEGVAQARAALARARAAEALAAENDARTQPLLAQGDLPAEQGDATRAALADAHAQVAAAQAALESAQANASLVADGPRDEDRAAANAEAQADRASAELATTTLAKTALYAPADALVESRDIEPGALAEPGTEALMLVDAGPPDIVVDVPETRLDRIVVGTPATLDVDGRRHGGRVSRIEPRADDATHTARVRVRAGGVHLQTGSVVGVSLGVSRDAGVAIDVGALMTNGARSSVEVYDEAHHTVHLQSVRVLASAGDTATVAGLAAGTPVVVMGEHEAAPGDAVRVVER
jgi:HlyD family secretion protein